MTFEQAEELTTCLSRRKTIQLQGAATVISSLIEGFIINCLYVVCPYGLRLLKTKFMSYLHLHIQYLAGHINIVNSLILFFNTTLFFIIQIKVFQFSSQNFIYDKQDYPYNFVVVQAYSITETNILALGQSQIYVLRAKGANHFCSLYFSFHFTEYDLDRC